MIATFVLLILISNIYNENIEKSYTKLSFVYVGQADASYIKTKDNINIVIDTGEGRTEKYESGLKIFLPFLLRNKGKNINHLFISHFHSDHSGGAYYILKYLNVDNLYIGFKEEENKLYNEIIQIAKEKNVNIYYLNSTMNLNIGKYVKIDVIYPGYKEKKDKNTNNNSLVLMLNISGRKILYTGDIEKETENKLIQRYINSNKLECDILKLPHHGSNTSSTEMFLKLTNPNHVIISCGKDNYLKHPSNKVLNRLNNLNTKTEKNKKINVLRLDEKGCVSFFIK